MIIVILSIIGILFDKLSSSKSIPINPTIIRVMRVLRIARVLKLLKMASGIRSLLDTVIQALPQVGNLALLFFLLFFIFAALGVELFGRLSKKNYKIFVIFLQLINQIIIKKIVKTIKAYVMV
jgi:voltage-dependent calcium channel T type alpha-1G